VKRVGRNLKNVWTLLPIALWVQGCATGKVSLQSVPSDADVYVAGLGKETPKLIGKTPLDLKSNSIEQELGHAGPFVVEMKKEGYLPVRTILIDIPSTDVLVSLELGKTAGLDDSDKLNAVIDQLFEAQKQIRSGRYDRAIELLKQVEQRFPQISATYELEGGVYYIQKNYKDALGAFSNVVKYEPNNVAALRMKSLLEKELGVIPGDAPAANNSPLGGLNGVPGGLGGGIGGLGGVGSAAGGLGGVGAAGGAGLDNLGPIPGPDGGIPSP
jgi:hypothetical protein